MLLFPWWVYLCIMGIIYSAYMAITSAKEEKEIDESFIEKEGQVYIDRMEKEREHRRKLVEIDSGLESESESEKPITEKEEKEHSITA